MGEATGCESINKQTKVKGSSLMMLEGVDTNQRGVVNNIMLVVINNKSFGVSI